MGIYDIFTKWNIKSFFFFEECLKTTYVDHESLYDQWPGGCAKIEYP